MKLLIALTVVLLSAIAYAEESSIRCNDDQSLCEIKNKRITIGDKIGVFTSDGFVVAIGVVTKIVGTARMFKITESYAKILRSHRAEIISDQEAENPIKSFKSFKTYADEMVGVNLGSYSLGIGSGFVANFAGLQYAYEWKKLTYFPFKLGYLSGEGDASAKLQGITNTKVTLSAISLSAGVSQILLPHEFVSIRVGFDLGIGHTQIQVEDEIDISVLLNDRVKEGMVMLARGEASLIYPWSGYYPMINVEILVLDKSFNPGISLGLLKSF